MAAYSIVTNDVVMVQMFGQLFGQRVMNQFYYTYNDLATMDDGPAAVQFLLTKFKGQVWATWKPAVSESYKLDYVQGTKVQTSRQAYEYLSINEEGTVVNDPSLPPANSLTMSRLGVLPGRGKQSSLHIAGLTTADTEAGEWTAAAVLRFAGLGAIIKAKLESSPGVLDAWWPTNYSVKYNLLRNYIRDVIVDNEVRTLSRRVVRQGI